MDALNYNGGTLNRIFKVYDDQNPVFQVSGSTVMSGTTDLLDIFSRVGMSGTVTSVAISGSDGIDVDSGSPITDSGTIALGLSNIDATKIANGTVTNTEFQFINTLGSNAQTQLDAKLPLAGGTMAGVIAMGTNKITGLGNPTAAQDATTKAYVDSLDVNYWSANTNGSITNSGNTDIVTNGTIAATSYNSTTSTNGYNLNGTKYLWREGDYLQVGNTTGTVPNTDIIGKSINLQTATTINDNLTVTGNTNISGDTTVIGNVISANEDVYMFSNRGQGQSDNTHWYGPNYQGIYNYSWSKDYGDDTEVLTLDEEYANAGLLVPYNCILTGFFTIGHSNSGTVGYSCGLWYVLQADLASSLNVTSGIAGDVTLSVGVSGTTVNPGNGKNPLTIDKRGTVSIALTAGSMIYPRVGDSAVVTDTTWNIYLKRT